MAATNCIDFATVTISTTAYNLVNHASPTLPSRAKGCVISIETDKVRWRSDGDAPSSTVGHEQAAASTLTFDSWSEPRNDWKQTLRAIQFIRSGTNDAKLMIHYYD